MGTSSGIQQRCQTTSIGREEILGGMMRKIMDEDEEDMDKVKGERKN